MPDQSPRKPPEDGHSAEMSRPALGDRRRWLAMPFIALGVAMIIVDATIVNVAVPTIIRELHTTAMAAEWINSIYALVFAALLITLGRIRDMFGRRRLFRIGGRSGSCWPVWSRRRLRAAAFSSLDGFCRGSAER